MDPRNTKQQARFTGLYEIDDAMGKEPRAELWVHAATSKKRKSSVEKDRFVELWELTVTSRII